MKKFIWSIFLFIIFIFLILFGLFNINKLKRLENKKEINYSTECISQESSKIVRNVSMEPMIMPGDELVLLEGYYDCNDIERGDIVAYDSASAEYPIIKKVLVLGGDSLEFRDNNLLVNNNILKNSVGEEYIFRENEKKMISLYTPGGKLKANTYLLFGDNVHSSLDSKNFGAVNKNGFIGKFVFDK